jgi:hypothetical protein
MPWLTWNHDLPISALQVARITGIIHWSTGDFFCFCEKFSALDHFLDFIVFYHCPKNEAASEL